MAMMNFVSHGTQDLYPTFLERQRHFTVNARALATAISMEGAVVGLLVFGYSPHRRGRRVSMVMAVLLAIAVIPLWILGAGANPALCWPAFPMAKRMVRGFLGVICMPTKRLTEAPPGFFPALRIKSVC